MDTERWKWVPEYKGYYKVSNLGRIKSVTRYNVNSLGEIRAIKGKLLSPTARKDGYRVVGLYRDGEGRRQYLLHHVVLQTFVGPCPQGQECRHLDDNSANNNLSNLCWGTSTENKQDARRNGKARWACGESQGRAKLTEGNVRTIRKAVQYGWLPSEMAVRYGVSINNICMIVNNKIWRHI